MDDKIVKPKIEDVTVIRAYPNVFPENLLRLPPDKEIEFTIELLPETALYRKLLIG